MKKLTEKQILDYAQQHNIKYSPKDGVPTNKLMVVRDDLCAHWEEHQEYDWCYKLNKDASFKQACTGCKDKEPKLIPDLRYIVESHIIGEREREADHLKGFVTSSNFVPELVDGLRFLQTKRKFKNMTLVQILKSFYSRTNE